MKRVLVKLEKLKENSIRRLESKISVIENQIKEELKKFNSINDLREFAFKLLKEEKTKEFNRLKENIKKFR